MTVTRDRYGEPIEDVDQDDHDRLCVAGWLPDAPDGKAVPCLTCRPHLTDRREQLRRRLEGPTR
jgi:hypothetical protein